MDRKDFLVRAAHLGAGCCGLALFGSAAAAGQSAASSKPPQAAGTPVTPDGKKVQWAKVWTKRFFEVFDQELDEPTRRRIMQRNGAACHQGALGGATPQTATLEQMVTAMAAEDGADSIRREGQVVYFNYTKNGAGLRVADGYCLCPLVEDGPPGLSGTFCECSVGYVRDMFETTLRRKVKVELLESLKRGGKTCRFRVEVLEA
jgi:hypothetical protein